MTYVGRGVDAISNVEKLDNITFNGGTTYNLTKSSAAFTPSGANNILVSMDGIIQSGNFTVAGSTIIFDFSPTSNNTCNFIMHYGTGVLNTPADDTVSAGKLQSNSVTTAKITDVNVTEGKIADNAITLAKMASGTDGNIISYDASGNPVAIATGTSGHFLKSQGAGNPPVFAGAGKIGQVVQTVKTDTFTSTSGSLTDITGMSAAITPTATSSKVLVTVVINIGLTAADRYAVLQLIRGSTAIALGGASSSRTRGSAAHVRLDATGTANEILTKSITFLDSPSSSSSVTYKMQGLVQTAGSPSFTINRSGDDADAAHGFRVPSSITLMEVLA